MRIRNFRFGMLTCTALIVVGVSGLALLVCSAFASGRQSLLAQLPKWALTDHFDIQARANRMQRKIRCG